MSSDGENPGIDIPSSPVAKLISLASDPKAIQFLLLILVLDAVGILPQLITSVGGVCA